MFDDYVEWDLEDDREQTERWKEIEMELTFEESLHRLSSKELESLHIHILSPDKRKKWTHDERLEHLLKNKESIMEKEIQYFTHEQAEILKLAAENPAVLIEEYNRELGIWWHDTSLLATGTFHGTNVLVMPNEFKRTFQQIYESQQFDRLWQDNEEWTKVTEKLLVYYGVLSFDELYALLRRYHYISSRDKKGHLKELFSYQSRRQWGIQAAKELGDDYYASIEVVDEEYTWSERGNYPDLDFAEIDGRVLALDSSEEVVLHMQSVQRFLRYLEKTYKVDRDIMGIILEEVYYGVVNDDEPTELLLGIVEMVEIKNRKQIDRLGEEFDHMLLNIPRWELKGHTLASFHNLEPKKPATSSQPSIARNADCPCGSGKKYKKCCM
ncbi:SEC-C metal-binding domain-containing protein [Chryseomicrobium sp. FSL W7-1435]|uniref:YecA family protein n=1 Tax=Chryseomicrobium sp. FSL W7-1435 TaxID=2921704 RepID=UPI00315B2C64